MATTTTPRDRWRDLQAPRCCAETRVVDREDPRWFFCVCAHLEWCEVHGLTHVVGRTTEMEPLAAPALLPPSSGAVLAPPDTGCHLCAIRARLLDLCGDQLLSLWERRDSAHGAKGDA